MMINTFSSIKLGRSDGDWVVIVVVVVNVVNIDVYQHTQE